MYRVPNGDVLPPILEKHVSDFLAVQLLLHVLVEVARIISAVVPFIFFSFLFAVVTSKSPRCCSHSRLVFGSHSEVLRVVHRGWSVTWPDFNVRYLVVSCLTGRVDMATGGHSTSQHSSTHTKHPSLWNGSSPPPVILTPRRHALSSICDMCACVASVAASPAA